MIGNPNMRHFAKLANISSVLGLVFLSISGLVSSDDTTSNNLDTIVNVTESVLQVTFQDYNTTGEDDDPDEQVDTGETVEVLTPPPINGQENTIVDKGTTIPVVVPTVDTTKILETTKIPSTVTEFVKKDDDDTAVIVVVIVVVIVFLIILAIVGFIYIRKIRKKKPGQHSNHTSHENGVVVHSGDASNLDEERVQSTSEVNQPGRNIHHILAYPDADGAANGFIGILTDTDSEDDGNNEEGDDVSQGEMEEDGAITIATDQSEDATVKFVKPPKLGELRAQNLLLCINDPTHYHIANEEGKCVKCKLKEKGESVTESNVSLSDGTIVDYNGLEATMRLSLEENEPEKQTGENPSKNEQDVNKNIKSNALEANTNESVPRTNGDTLVGEKSDSIPVQHENVEQTSIRNSDAVENYSNEEVATNITNTSHKSAEGTESDETGRIVDSPVGIDNEAFEHKEDQ